MIKLRRYVACICEGGAERAIIDLLLDNDKLIFDRRGLLDGELIRTRKAKEFEKKYLRKEFLDKITILRILDSRREEFTLSKEYRAKVDVINVITAPEIEMLVICNEGHYEKYKKSNKKPSQYCIEVLKYKEVKSYEWVKKYFGDIDALLNTIKEYRRVSKVRDGEYALYDLLKEINEGK